MTGKLAHIFRHPVKAHGREALASVMLSAGQALPWDRHWAVAHNLSKFDGAAPAWVSCVNFQRAARTPSLQAISARYDEALGLLTLSHPDLPDITLNPETEGQRLIDWVLPISPQERFRPTALVKAPGRAMTDSSMPTVSIKNLASNADLAAFMGCDLSIDRWRGNLWLEGFDPWAEMGWIGRRLRIGGAVIEIREKVGRCRATMANPLTGQVDLDTLSALQAKLGATDFGVFGVVLESGPVATGDPVEFLS